MLNHLRFSLGCLALTWLSLTVSVMGMDPTGESAREDVASIGTAGSDDDQPPAQEKPGAVVEGHQIGMFALPAYGGLRG